MRAVIAAAGEGTRLRPLTDDVPKCLLPVAGRPILEHSFRALAPLSPEALVVVVGRLGDQVAERFGGAWRGIPILYPRQLQPLGLAHALRLAAPYLDGDFLAMHGDLVLSPGVDLSRVVHRLGGPGPGGREGEDVSASILVEVRPPERVSRGAVRVDGRGDVRELAEHPDARRRAWGRVAAGFYAFRREVLDACARVEPSDRGEYELPDALQEVLRRGGRVVATELGRELGGTRVNVNTLEDLARAERLLGSDGRTA